MESRGTETVPTSQREVGHEQVEALYVRVACNPACGRSEPVSRRAGAYQAIDALSRAGADSCGQLPRRSSRSDSAVLATVSSMGQDGD
jgi:hypothetical protein